MPTEWKFYGLLNDRVTEDGYALVGLDKNPVDFSENFSQEGSKFTVSYQDPHGRILYQETEDIANNQLLVIAQNHDFTIRRTFLMKANKANSEIIDTKYEKVDPVTGKVIGQLEVVDKSSKDKVKTNYYGSKFVSTLSSKTGNEPDYITNYVARHSDTTTKIAGKLTTINNAQSGTQYKNYSVTVGFSETRCLEGWNSIINGKTYQINMIPSTFSMHTLQDLRYHGHWFIEMNRVVNRLNLFTADCNFSFQTELSCIASASFVSNLLNIELDNYGSSLFSKIANFFGQKTLQAQYNSRGKASKFITGVFVGSSTGLAAVSSYVVGDNRNAEGKSTEEKNNEKNEKIAAAVVATVVPGALLGGCNLWYSSKYGSDPDPEKKLIKEQDRIRVDHAHFQDKLVTLHNGRRYRWLSCPAFSLVDSVRFDIVN